MHPHPHRKTDHRHADTYSRARHNMSAPHAHLIFVTNYRRPLFTAEMLTSCEHTMHTICDKLDAELIEFNGETDHMHLLAAYAPNPGDFDVGCSGSRGAPLTRRRESPAPASAPPMRGQPVVPSYFTVSRGGAPLSIIKHDIDRQTRPL
jgi:REP-associated tyrosine transposase